MIGNKKEKPEMLELLSPCDIPIVRYIKIKGSCNPFDPIYSAYLDIRRKAKNYLSLESNTLAAGLRLNEG